MAYYRNRPGIIEADLITRENHEELAMKYSVGLNEIKNYYGHYIVRGGISGAIFFSRDMFIARYESLNPDRHSI